MHYLTKSLVFVWILLQTCFICEVRKKLFSFFSKSFVDLIQINPNFFDLSYFSSMLKSLLYFLFLYFFLIRIINRHNYCAHRNLPAAPPNASAL